MNIKIIKLLPILAVLMSARSFAQSAQSVDNSGLICGDIFDNHWDYPKLDFPLWYIGYGGLNDSSGPYYLVPGAEIDYVAGDGVTLLGTNISESSSSPITGSSDLTFSNYPDPQIMTSSSPYFDDAFNGSDLSGYVTAGYEYYYSVNGSGEIFLNYDLTWTGYIDGWLPPDGSYENQDDSFDSGYLSVDTTINVSDLPVYSSGGGGD